MQYLIDTNICIFFLRGKLNLLNQFQQKGRENCFISEITVLELRFGAENGTSKIKSHKAVNSFLEGLTIIPIFNCINRYAIEKVKLRKIGKPMNDEFDLLIAATALENNLTLVTDNGRDFRNLPSLKIENWYR